MKGQKGQIKNPEAPGVHDAFGKAGGPGCDHQQAQVSRTPASLEPAPSLGSGRKNRSCFVLATSIIIVGVSTIALSRLVIGDTGGEYYYGERDFFTSVEVNGYFAVAAGVGMALYYLSLGQGRSSLPRIEEQVTGSTIEKSFFRRMEPSMFSGADYRAGVCSAAPEDRVGAGIKVILYLLSACIPAVGFVAGAILYSNPRPNKTCVGRTCMLLSAASLALIAALGVLLFVVILPREIVD